MADIAIGRTCSNDGTLTACSGSFSDEDLTASCPVCKQTVSVPNPQFTGVRSVPTENPAGDLVETPVEETLPVPPDPIAPITEDDGA